MGRIVRRGKRSSSCLIFVSVLLFSITALAADKAPSMLIDNPVHEFGSVSQGSKVEHIFPITNTGNSELHIQRVVASCGCTASAVDKDVIAPGEGGEIKVTFDTSGFSGDKTKTVRVYSNDIDHPILMLSLKGTIEPDVFVVPQRVFFGDVVKGVKDQQLQAEVSVKVREGAKVKLGGVRAYSQHFEVEELTSTPTEKKLLIKLNPEAPLGEIRERAIISISGSKRKAINIPIFASIKGHLRMSPKTLSFGVLEGEGLQRSVRLENLGPERIKITNIKSNNKAVTAEYKPLKEGKLFVVKVSVDPKKLDKDLRASIKIDTDSKLDKTVSLNVYGIKPPKG